MADMMTFPNTVEEFMEQYKIVDTEEVYTNGADLVPIFRMMQWFEHVSATDTISRQAAIDALHTWFRDGFDEDKWWNSTHVLAAIEGLPPAQLGTNLAEVGTRTVRGYPIDADALMETVAEEYGERARDTLYRIIRDMPPAQQNLSEEYAKAVRNWLVNYQIKCAELKGRYTPYEVLGWIVSDWRKENGIW